MPLYRYKAVNGAGDIVEGTMDAPTQRAAVHQLSGSGLTPIRADVARAPFWKQPLRFELRRRRAPTTGQLALFTRELAMLLDAGLPLDRALQATLDLDRDDASWPVRRVVERVRGGSSLAHALTASGGFPGFYSGMVEAGEASGNLASVLYRLTEYLESMARLGESLRSALIYPAIVAVVCFGSLGVFIGFVLPQFEGILHDAGVAVPTGIAVMLGASQFVGTWWWLMAVVGLALVAPARRQFARPEIRRARDRVLLRVPLIGGLVRKTIAARFARTLGLLLQNGVTLSTALGIARATVTNAVLLEALDRVAVSVREGKGFAAPLARAGILPELAGQLIAVGEETARLGEILGKVADIYDWDLRRTLDRTVAILVPAITVVMGVIVAVVVGSILSAMFSIYNVAL